MAVSRRVAALCGSAGIALFALSGPALAEEFGWSATLTGTSDYVFRGVSQTDNDPTVQASIGATYGMFYVGAWGSGVDFVDGAEQGDIEIDYYGGITPTWGPATFDFGLIYYTYPGWLEDSDLLELKVGVSGEILPKLAASAIYYYSPDYNDAEYGVTEGSLSYGLPAFHMFSPSISGLVGYVDDYQGGTDYTYWNAGLALGVDKLTFDFRYWDTDLSDGACVGQIPSTCDERFVFTTTLALP